MALIAPVCSVHNYMLCDEPSEGEDGDGEEGLVVSPGEPLQPCPVGWRSQERRLTKNSWEGGGSPTGEFLLRSFKDQCI